MAINASIVQRGVQLRVLVVNIGPRSCENLKNISKTPKN